MEGLQNFKKRTLETFPEVQSYWHYIEKFIVESETKKIEIHNIKVGIAVSLYSGVIFTEKVFKQQINNFLFTVFHEFTHQYQFKKYGIEKMLELYSDRISFEDGAILMKQIELVADEMATRKLRELQKKGFLSQSPLPKGIYKDIPLTSFVSTIKNLKSQVKDLGLKSSYELNDIFYSWLKS
jgi:hypothetical protein